MDMTALMERAIANRASDLHLQEGRPPMMRVAAGLSALPTASLDRSGMHRALNIIGWSGDGDGDGAFSWNASLRCRLHVCREEAGLHLAIRFLYPLEDLPEDRDQRLLTSLGKLSDWFWFQGRRGAARRRPYGGFYTVSMSSGGAISSPWKIPSNT